MKTRLLVRPLAALAALLFASPAWPVCSYLTMSNDVPYLTSGASTTFQYTQGVIFWSAVAVRPAAGEDWDLDVFGATAPDPTCVTGLLAGSSYGTGKTDFVIGDFNHNPTGTYYPHPYRYSGSADAYVEWDGNSDQLLVNGSATREFMTGNSLIRVFDVYLNSGTTYTFDFFPQGGSSAHLLLFRNTGGGVYWAGRASAEFDVTSSTTYAATATGYFGVVVVNDGFTPFTYALGVTASGCGVPVTLATGASVNIASPGGRFAFDASSAYWTGIAVKPSAGDWDLQLHSLPSGNPPPVCVSSQLTGSSASASVVDLTVGDFNHTPLGYYFAYAFMFNGGAGGQVQNTGSSGWIPVNDNPVVYSMAATDVAHMRDVYLEAGRTYAITFSPNVGQTLLLFANVPGTAYFAGRGSAALSTNTSTTYTAPVTAWYGLAVVNDGGGAGTYALGVGDCGLVSPLVSEVAQTNGAKHNAYYSFDQQAHYWTAISTRCTTLDWDLYVNGDNVASPAPVCATTSMAASGGSLPLQDFVVGDFNYNSTGTYYAHAKQFTAGGAAFAQVEWDSGSDEILPNDNNTISRPTGPTDLITCWDIYLTSGQQYQFNLVRFGAADTKLLLFRNTLAGTYWASRGNAQFSTTSTQLYTPPSTGYYGVVVVNDNAASGSYDLFVRTCNPVLALAPAPSSTSPASSPVVLASFNQIYAYWTPVAVRPTSPSEDWDIEAFTTGSGGPISVCLSGSLANSQLGSGKTDFVIGDFNYVTAGTYYARAHRYWGTGDGQLQWAQGSQIMYVNDPYQVRTVAPTNVIEAWDTYLTSGQQYSVFFAYDPGLNAKVLVFEPTGGAFWGGRSDALFEDNKIHTFTAGATGYHGIVVVVDGGTGPYYVGIYTGVIAVDPVATPERTLLRGVWPNPGHAGMRFAYALREPGAASFDVIDMSGRIVSRLSPGDRGAGEWTDAWSATDDSGRRLRPGIYFVRMRFGSRVVGTRKLTLLE